ncbi:MAG: adenylosuccinate lyase [Candidatus Muiribacteriota bacterium]
MIDRYETEEIRKIWSEQGKFSAYTEIEILACEAWNKLDKIPDSDLENIKSKAAFQVERIEEIEKITNHDLIAYVENLAENIGPSGRFVHMGLTSSDIVDTALTLRIVRSIKFIEEELENLINILKNKVDKYKNTVCLGRTHGVAAEPTTFGVKLAVFYTEMKRNLERLRISRENIRVGKLSGAVGTYSNIEPFVEKYVLNSLNLEVAPVSGQVIQRDRIAEVFWVLAAIGAGMEKIALEIRHLQRTEVREAQEGFTKGQKGSSAMPHKKNPIISERICGMARILRANLMASMENIALWHERDISHSSVERVLVPDSFHLTHYMLKKTCWLVENLIVNEKKMLENIENLNGLIFSQKALLALCNKGLSRKESYEIIQKMAMKSWEDNSSLKDNLKNNDEVKKYLSIEELEKIFDINSYLEHIDYIYEKINL